jgi:hypothetical protein
MLHETERPLFSCREGYFAATTEPPLALHSFSAMVTQPLPLHSFFPAQS